MVDIGATSYQAIFEENFREICGGVGSTANAAGVSQTLDGFSSWAQDTGLLREIVEGTATPSNVVSAYRRYLGRGANCPEGTVGRGRWAAARSLDRAYTSRIAAINDPAVYLAEWNAYIAAFIEFLQRTRETLAGSALEEVGRILGPLLVARRVASSFLRPKGSWGNNFVVAQVAELNNLANGIQMKLDLIAEGITLPQPTESFVRSLQAFLDPLRHITSSFANDHIVLERLIIEVGGNSEGASFDNPITLRRLIDEIVYEMGRVAMAMGIVGQVDVGWDNKARTLSFTDLTEGLPLLRSFGDEGGRPLRLITQLTQEIGPTSELYVIRYDDGSVGGLRVSIPQSGFGGVTVVHGGRGTSEERRPLLGGGTSTGDALLDSILMYGAGGSVSYQTFDAAFTRALAFR